MGAFLDGKCDRVEKIHKCFLGTSLPEIRAVCPGSMACRGSTGRIDGQRGSGGLRFQGSRWHLPISKLRQCGQETIPKCCMVLV